MTEVVLGIDPQATRLGLALVEFEAPHRALWADTVSIDEPDGGWRYHQVARALREVPGIYSDGARKHHQSSDTEIVRVGIESPPHVNNAAIFRGIAGVESLVQAEAHRRWPWAPQVSANVATWKKAVLGDGRASKDDVHEWAANLVYEQVGDQSWAATQDACDALAIATYAAGVELEERAA